MVVLFSACADHPGKSSSAAGEKAAFFPEGKEKSADGPSGTDTVILSDGVHADVPESRLFVSGDDGTISGPQGALFRPPAGKEGIPARLPAAGRHSDPGNLGTILAHGGMRWTFR